MDKLIAQFGDKMAPIYYLVVFSIVGAIAAWFMPETRGRDLEANSEAA